MKAAVRTPPRVWLVWFQQTSKALTRLIEVAELSGDTDTAKELLEIKRLFNHCFYKEMISRI